MTLAPETLGSPTPNTTKVFFPTGESLSFVHNPPTQTCLYSEDALEKANA
jgi:hypothetical protein